jgi:hypothetical protein
MLSLWFGGGTAMRHDSMNRPSMHAGVGTYSNLAHVCHNLTLPLTSVSKPATLRLLRALVRKPKESQ